ncbi:hypothetical protein ACN42_g10555 [Penicillium freii]|uniref:Uncharacterized protein n=1 Tax=Penicillium freii TaxID=48697 RepID=A0A101M9U3_PENFR|nr:hypothetical protein ACN42_g10555 [Penicillium freii]
MVITLSTLTINQSGIGWMVITPSTLTINQSGIGVVLVFGVLGVWGFGGSVDSHHSIHPQSICIGVVLLFGVLGVGEWVITPSTINQSGIGVVFGVFVVLRVGR